MRSTTFTCINSDGLTDTNSYITLLWAHLCFLNDFFDEVIPLDTGTVSPWSLRSRLHSKGFFLSVFFFFFTIFVTKHSFNWQKGGYYLLHYSFHPWIEKNLMMGEIEKKLQRNKIKVWFIQLWWRRYIFRRFFLLYFSMVNIYLLKHFLRIKHRAGQ